MTARRSVEVLTIQFYEAAEPFCSSWCFHDFFEQLSVKCKKIVYNDVVLTENFEFLRLRQTIGIE